MAQEVKYDVLLENRVNGDYYSTSPTHLLLFLTEESVQTLQAARKAYEAAVEKLPGEFVYGLEVSFRAFDYMVADEEAEPDKSGVQPLEQWDDSWEIAKVRVNQDGYRFTSFIKHADIGMESEMLSFARLDEELRKFRALQLAASIEGAMPDAASAPAKSSGMSPI